jgi:hypothetical protein
VLKNETMGERIYFAGDDRPFQQKMLPALGVTAFFITLQMNYLVVKPFSLASFRQAVIPFLLMVRIASVETLRVTHLSSSGI